MCKYSILFLILTLVLAQSSDKGEARLLKLRERSLQTSNRII